MALTITLQLLCVIACVQGILYTDVNQNLVIRNADRIIDITTQLVKISTTISIVNTGALSTNEFLWAGDHGNAGRLDYINVRQRDQEFKYEMVWLENQPGIFYKIKLNKNLNKDSAITLTIEEVLSFGLHPFPKSIKQKENQLVRYIGDQYLYSPYLVTKQTTKVFIPTKNIESCSKLKPFTQSDGLLSYGPYESIEPFNHLQLTVHYENNSPFLSVTNLNRKIDVSHWGNIAIEESISLLHTGATLSGCFSRFDFQQDLNSGKNSVKSFKTILPAAAEKLYYRDFNGNISTSNMRVKKDSVELDLRPRFPLFGGWKTSYTIGYNVPSYQYLYHKGDVYVLKIRLIDHVYDDMRVDNLETEITLPVGATNVKLATPYEVKRLEDSVSYKYLDMKGRPVIRFSKQNLVENHIQDFTLEYNWHQTLMIHEPVLLIFALYMLFLCVIVYVRLDFTIDKYRDAKKNE